MSLISLLAPISVFSVPPWCNGFWLLYHHGGTENTEEVQEKFSNQGHNRKKDKSY